MQEQQTDRISLKHLFDELLKVLNFEKGILLTIRDLFIKPKQMIWSYLKGDRKKYTKPLQFLIVTVGIAVFIFQDIEVQNTFQETFQELGERGYKAGYEAGCSDCPPSEAQTQENKEQTNKIVILLTSNQQLLIFFSIPLIAGLTFLFYKKAQLNYPEHLVLNAYSIGAQSAISVLFSPFLLFSSTTFMVLSSIFSGLYGLWFLQQSFGEGYKKGWLKAILVNVITIPVIMLVGGILGAISVLLFNF